MNSLQVMLRIYLNDASIVMPIYGYICDALRDLVPNTQKWHSNGWPKHRSNYYRNTWENSNCLIARKTATLIFSY